MALQNSCIDDIQTFFSVGILRTSLYANRLFTRVIPVMIASWVGSCLILVYLTTKYIGNEVKQEAVVLVGGLIMTSTFQGTEPARRQYGWLDNNGQNEWEAWTPYIEDKNNTIWEVTLNVVNATDGTKKFYDIGRMKK